MKQNEACRKYHKVIIKQRVVGKDRPFFKQGLQADKMKRYEDLSSAMSQQIL